MKSKISNELLTETYLTSHSVWKTGEVVGLCGQSVQERLDKLGIERDGRSLRHPLIISICPNCKKEFYPRENRSRQKFCSRECGFEGHPPRQSLVNHPCLNCGSPIPHTEECKRKSYCSKICRRAAYWLTKRCPICFTEFESYRARLKRYCSRECHNKGLLLRQMGSSSHFWQGGKTDALIKIRQHPLYSEWRRKIFQRDEYTCQICLDVGGQLTAHHVIPFSENPKLRLKVPNGITLCWTCHQNFHKDQSANKIATDEATLSDAARHFFEEEPGVAMFKNHGDPFEGAGRLDWEGCILGRFVGIELKALYNFPSPAQKFRVRRIQAAGGAAFICRSMEEVRQAVCLVKESALV